MKPERWNQIEGIYQHAQQCVEAERDSFLDQACAGDEELRREIESLLRADEQARSFLGTPALNLAAQMIAEEQSSSLEGKSISRYQIAARIGAGGMGEVYSARDTRLNRDVAIKVLPANLSRNSDALARFEREAMAVAALSHPNILAIHDFGQEEEVTFAVTELLEGETLRDRLSRSQLTWPECIEVAVAVCEGLTAAHAKGIIHRDLKPENIFVTQGGNVKVLDFGLARMKVAPITSAATTVAASPNITQAGAVIGTAGYMSPEQVRGEKVDAASDIFSLGCVLYEMLVGRRPFVGETIAERMASVLRDEPPQPSAARKDLPEELDRVLSRCLKKTADERYKSAREFASDLRAILSSHEISASHPVHLNFRRIVWIMSALTLVIAVALTYWLTRRNQSLSASNASVSPLKSIPLTSYNGIELFPSFSPDGTQVTFAWDGPTQDNFDIYTRTVEHGTPVRLTTDPAEDFSPAWSPDGRFIAFLRHISHGRAGLFLTTPLSHAERLLTEIVAPNRGVGYWGPHLGWSPDSKWIATVDKISPNASSGLFLISADTGEKRPISLPAVFSTVISPSFSPDGRSLVFIRIFGFFVSELYLLSLTEDLNARGEPIQLTFFKNQRTASPVWTRDGREIVFDSGDAGNGYLYRIAIDEPGKPRRVESVEKIHHLLAISYAGHRIAYVRTLWDTNIWRVQLGVNDKLVASPSSLISSTRADLQPQFSPDGKQVAFISDRSGDTEVWVSDSDGSNARQLTSFGGVQTDCARWSPDGARLVFQTYPEGHLDIFLINVRGGPPERLTRDRSDDNLPSWSRDGSWIYFTSTRSGSMQVWKMRTDGSGAVQLTKGGGYGPKESTDGKRLYYAKGTRPRMAVWQVPIDGGEEVEVFTGIFDWNNYLPTEKGIYFTPFTEAAEAASIRFFNFADGKIKTITTLAKPIFLGLTISPDGRSLLYTQLDQKGFDLMLAENFQ